MKHLGRCNLKSQSPARVNGDSYVCVGIPVCFGERLRRAWRWWSRLEPAEPATAARPGFLPDGPGLRTGLSDLAGPAGACQPGIAGYLFLRGRNPVLSSPLSLELQYVAPPEPPSGKAGGQPRFSVDIFVPCCGEPVEIITTTLRAVGQITYHPLEVYVLDDAGSRGGGRPGPILGISLPLPPSRRSAPRRIPRAAISISV